MIVALKIQLEDGLTFWSCYYKGHKTYSLLMNSNGAFDNEGIVPNILNEGDKEILKEIILEK